MKERMLNQPIDVSEEFTNPDNTFLLPTKLANYHAAKGEGRIECVRHTIKPRTGFNQTTPQFETTPAWEFPAVYGERQLLPFSLSFINDRTIRLRVSARQGKIEDAPSLMLAKKPRARKPWKTTAGGKYVNYKGKHGGLRVSSDPWRMEFLDAHGKLLTRTWHQHDFRGFTSTMPMPFSAMRLAGDFSRRFAASFSLSADEKIFGCGESFTRLDKRGQKFPIWTSDAHGVLTDWMYKPIPFFLSNRGYGMFFHTTAPLTCDFGRSYDAANTVYLGDDQLDLFFFFGEPKDIVGEYTALTGRSPMPPLWSFGLWMSRCTYDSEAQARGVAAAHRRHRVPCDVINLDTGWFEQDWCCDYEFSRSRFKAPKKMLADLKKQGFRVCLWQLPYFTPANKLFNEIVRKGLAVKDRKGNLATEDAVLDFSNPKAVRWYQDKLAGLLRLGVAAIKVDFGEAAPLAGQYHSGKSGFFEHNHYPLRYNKAAAEIIKKVTGEHIIWARSTWAGSQRYPLHWAGDAECTYEAMAATLRAGISLGLCGFSFWSHDIGGFIQKTPRELYRRWLPFGMLTSHSRCHGQAPKEPWEFGKEFLDEFRKGVELKYRLMPYVYAQAKDCSDKGEPMLRPLFFNYPCDATSWMIEDEYLFGNDILVAPIFAEKDERKVYLPPGAWIDYQTGNVYEGASWHAIKAGEIPAVILVRDGAVLPHAALAQHTGEINWKEIELRVFKLGQGTAKGLLYRPGDKKLTALELVRDGVGFRLKRHAFKGKVKFDITQVP